MIDGGVIGNNPSLIAWTLKHYGDNSTKSKNIRILSLGAGENKREPIIENANSYNTLTQVQGLVNLATTTPSELAEFYLKNYYKSVNKPNNFLRCQVITTANAVSVGAKAVAGMKSDGLKMWDESKDKIQEFLRRVVDQKIGNK